MEKNGLKRIREIRKPRRKKNSIFLRIKKLRCRKTFAKKICACSNDYVSTCDKIQKNWRKVFLAQKSYVAKGQKTFVLTMRCFMALGDSGTEVGKLGQVFTLLIHCVVKFAYA
jgi:hypothetical protein